MSIRNLTLGAALCGLSSCILFSSCFIAGTRVLTPRGPRRIEALAVGDEVWSWSLSDGAPVTGRVSRVLRSRASAVYTLEAGELRIDGVTATHPFWNPVRQRWMKVEELALGDAVLAWLGSDEPKVLQITRLERTEGAIEVFDLTVEGEHDFFAEGILVHNKSVIEPEEDVDGDGYSNYEDCDDDDSTVHPRAPEQCTNDRDDDCDGDVDTDDEDCDVPRFEPDVGALCTTFITSLAPVLDEVVDVRFTGPAIIDVLAMEARHDELLLTLEVLPASNEGLNDAVLTLQDDTELVLIESFAVQGSDCTD